MAEEMKIGCARPGRRSGWRNTRSGCKKGSEHAPKGGQTDDSSCSKSTRFFRPRLSAGEIYQGQAFRLFRQMGLALLLSRRFHLCLSH